LGMTKGLASACEIRIEIYKIIMKLLTKMQEKI